MRPLYSVDDTRKIEQAAQASLPPGTLMQKAGNIVADKVRSMMHSSRLTSVLVLAGPGNNGGDALVAAADLADGGVDMTVLLFADPDRQSEDARQALRAAEAKNIRIAWKHQLAEIESRSWQLVIDGLFGIGLRSAIAGDIRAVVEAVNRLDCPVLSIDVPSGLDADTGCLVGPDGVAVHATRTVTFITDKPGLHTCDGKDYAGNIEVCALDLPSEHFPEPHLLLNEPSQFSSMLPARRQNSHKGSYGDLAVVGGAAGMGGAVILAARAAAKCGAGRVFAVFEGPAPAYDAESPELMCRALADFHHAGMTLTIGPGLGTSEQAQGHLAKFLSSDEPLVLDADALNLIASSDELRRLLAARNGGTILTPHPLEAARLLQTDAASIQSNRIAAARELARRFNAVIVLKGSGSIIAKPDGLAAINPTGNPGLSTAGTGDVLAGVCGALTAQRMPLWEAALAATWLHGRAADVLVSEGIGPAGLTASELIPAIRSGLNRLAAGANHAKPR